MPTPDETTNKYPSWFEDLRYTDDVDTQYMRALVYGPMGSGKTRFALTWPKPFVIDFDHGLLTGRNLKVPAKQFNPPKDRRDRQRLYQTVVDILVEARDRTGPFSPDGPLADRETIIIDGYTAMADFFLKEILLTSGLDFISDKPQFEHWHALAARLDNITWLTAQLPYHVVSTCGDKQDKDEQSGAWIGLPDIVGGFRNDIGYKFDEVYYFSSRRARSSDTESKGNLVYEMHTAKFGIFDAKSRLDLPPTLIDPSFEKIWAAAKSERSPS